MDDGGPGQTKGVVKEETWGERTGRRGARPERGVAKEETQGESGRGSADRGQGGGVAIQGT